HVVRVDDGRVFPVRREEMFKPQEGMEMRPSSPDEVIKKYNKEIWDEGMMKLIDSKRVADRELGSGIKSYMNELKEMEKDKELSKERKEMLRQQYEDQISGTVMEANHYYRRIQDGIESMYNQLQKDLVNRKRMIREIDDPIERERTKKDIENMNKALESISVQWKKSAPELKKLDEERRASGLSGERKKEIDYKTFEENKKLVDNVIPQLDEMRMISPQKLFVPIEKFAKDKAAETFSNIAFQINQECEKTGRKAPIISIENVFPNMAFSRADQLRELIDESREKFVMKAVDSGMSKEKAWDTAEKLIGATWDVAHLNLIRKEGRSAEGSVEEMERQTKLIAPYVKKVHIVDNFGFSDSHIPLGMGNVPKEKLMNIMKENEFAGPMISEAVAFAQQFKMSPHVFELEALGAPLNYPGFGGPSMSESRSLYGSSFTGYGNFLPEQHFAMYGGGFSGLPLELGGRVAGGKSSQFSGTPME
ncbi:MAG: hypothetical protein KKE23_01435, partial [Nanoarchaeota archaeon]|nr:hypothetical protein [Nanoarchaeota archaeon]